MTEVNLRAKVRKTNLTALQKLSFYYVFAGFNGYIVDNSGNRFVDNSGNLIPNQDADARAYSFRAKKRKFGFNVNLKE